ncbi:hypothetical protein RSOLAG1IB_10225 [Rhizoctonia solani AG-1 IB]|uniref:Uncharacterized protein n=1 Tax=Thanatephorus cucumeris (strain AG1-IB / isolate 7/3/14) TaxID=1108050 RepID=A0A0B7G0W7_THACB|nr:hypothetical protein RSOLAG1IB_10225 [Rhizoctonia solani AG-1 IB]
MSKNQFLSGTKQTEDSAKSKVKKGNKTTIDNKIDYSNTESETGEQDGQSSSESGVVKLESKESKGKDFWGEAFNLELELGEEAFNKFSDTMSKEAPEYKKPNDNNCCKLGEKWLQVSSWTGTCQKIPNFQASKEVASSLRVQ